jgi:superfamily II DNA or RNA helicase
MNIQLRPYQEKCKRAIKENYDKGVREQLIVEATGLGKRLQSVELMRHFNRSLFIAHREELIGQAYDEIEKFWPMEVGIIKGQAFEIDKRIVVASVQTLQNRLDRIKPETFDYIVVDEAHNYLSPSYLRTIRHFKPKLRTAWTATPKRLDGLSLTNIAQELVFQYRIEDGMVGFQ